MVSGRSCATSRCWVPSATPKRLAGRWRRAEPRLSSARRRGRATSRPAHALWPQGSKTYPWQPRTPGFSWFKDTLSVLGPRDTPRRQRNSPTHSARRLWAGLPSSGLAQFRARPVRSRRSPRPRRHRARQRRHHRPSLASRYLQHVNWLEPWHPLQGDSIGAFEPELRREAGDGHPLHGVPVRGIGRRHDCDDVLFALEDGTGRVAVVHLTWTSTPPEQLPWPRARIWPSVDAWAAEGMRADHDEFAR